MLKPVPVVLKPKIQSKRDADAAFKIVRSSKGEQQLKREVRAPDDDGKTKKTAKPAQVEDESYEYDVVSQYSYTYDYDGNAPDWQAEGPDTKTASEATNTMQMHPVAKNGDID